jgi:hypothetical protein
MSPNPVCYNGVNLPDNSIHVGKVSLGIRPKDYRADTAQNWRSGIRPNGAVVLYSNTYDLEITDQIGAEPRIWWTNPAATIDEFKLKITELLSRLPERAAVNYQVFGSYDAAIDWLHDTAGKYSLVNDDYPEYYIPGEHCIFNIETGLFASYPASGLHIHSLANPNEAVGNSLNPKALSWHGFTITNAAADLNINEIGREPGLRYSPTGHVISIDTLRGEDYSGNNLVFEAIINIPYSNGESTIFTVLDSSTSGEVVRFQWDPSTEQFSAHYPTLGSIIKFEPVTSPWTTTIHVVVSIPASNDPAALSAAVLLVNGASFAVSAVTGSSFEWNNSTFFQIGNNAALTRPITELMSAKAYLIEPGSAAALVTQIKDNNVPIFQSLYL